MDKELFLKEVAKAATAYAEATVYQPELHKDAIDSVFQDFMEGASTAYDILTQNESGNDN